MLQHGRMHLTELLSDKSIDVFPSSAPNSPRLPSSENNPESARSNEMLVVDVSFARDAGEESPRMRSPLTNKRVKSKLAINMQRLNRLKSSSGLRQVPQSCRAHYIQSHLKPDVSPVTPKHTVRKCIEE